MLSSNRLQLRASVFALTSLGLSLNLVPAVAQPATEPDTFTLATHANKAADAYKQKNWGMAKEEFRFCIGQRPRATEFYEGLYNTCMKSGEWDQVAFALERIFAMDPNRKTELSYDYGQALFHVNRYDAAVPYLKTALVTVDMPKSLEYIPKVRRVPDIQYSLCKLQPTPVSLSYVAALKSECICLAEYEGYDESDAIGWNHAPQAHYHITEILKGPPLSSPVLVKYEFHDLVNQTMPRRWTFSDKVMPEKGSKWILFIEYALPRHGLFELYEGSYGRQPATDENVKHLNSLLDKYNIRNPHS